MNYYRIKYNKYLTKMSDISNVSYYFNSYGKKIPTKYSMLLNLLTFNKASDKEYNYIQKNADIIANDDHYSKCKLIIGSYNMICTLFTKTSVLNFVITDNNTCYIETFCGLSDILLNLLKEICNQYGIYKIYTFSIYQPLTTFLLQNGFNKNKNNELEFFF
jgi:hypothetical protein